MIADRYAAASDLTPDALLAIWRSIPTDRQEAIGVKLLGHYLAELVADDDGLISTEDERDAAYLQSQEDFQALFETVQEALPQVLWHYPDDMIYEARDASGDLLGTVDMIEHRMSSSTHQHVHQFRPACRGRRRGPKVQGEPVRCLPPGVRNHVDMGGWFGAKMPDGRRYPNQFSSLAPEL